MRLPRPADLFKAPAAARVRDAMGQAQARAGGEGRLIIIAVSLFGAAFLLLAITAPLGLALPGLLSTLVSFMPFLVLLGGIGVGGLALVRVIAGKGAAALEPGSRPTLADGAIDAALGEAIDAGLLPASSRRTGDAMSGLLAGCPVVFATSNEVTIAAIRLPGHAASKAVPLLITPAGTPWPGPLPSTASLTPLTPPAGLAIQAWGNSVQRTAGQSLLTQIAPSLRLADAGGGIPHLALIERTLLLRWPGADTAGAALIAADLAGRLVPAAGRQG